jgi:hypothetical protein
LLAIQTRSSALGLLAHEQIYTHTTRSFNHSSNSGRLMNLNIFICHA